MVDRKEQASAWDALGKGGEKGRGNGWLGFGRTLGFGQVMHDGHHDAPRHRTRQWLRPLHIDRERTRLLSLSDVQRLV